MADEPSLEGDAGQDGDLSATPETGTPEEKLFDEPEWPMTQPTPEGDQVVEEVFAADSADDEAVDDAESAESEDTESEDADSEDAEESEAEEAEADPDEAFEDDEEFEDEDFAEDMSPADHIRELFGDEATEKVEKTEIQIPAEDEPTGEELEGELADPGELEIVDDEAEELEAEEYDETPDKADPEDVEIDDEEQLEEAEAVAVAAKSTRPVKRKLTQAPVKKDIKTPKRDEKPEHHEQKRTTPAQFIRQSVGELKKVVWPSGDDLGQHFLVVLIFVVVLMMFVFGLDNLFGWGLLQVFGK